MDMQGTKPQLIAQVHSSGVTFVFCSQQNFSNLALSETFKEVSVSLDGDELWPVIPPGQAWAHEISACEEQRCCSRRSVARAA